MDFNFNELFENSRSLRSCSFNTDDNVEDYLDDYYSEEEDYDSDEEWMAEYRLSKMTSSDKREFNHGLSDEEKQELIASGQQLLVSTFQQIHHFDEKYFRSARITPVPVNLDVTLDHHSELQDYFQNEYESDEEIKTSSVDLRQFNYKKDSIIAATINLVSLAYDKSQTDEASEFQAKYQNFLTHYKGWKYKYYRNNFFSQLNTIQDHSKRKIILDILNFQEPSNGKLNNVFIVYVPSGGGKTTLYKKYKNFCRLLDVDEFIKANYESFKIFKDYYDSLEDINKNGLMNLWFKYYLHKNNINNQLSDTIMLFNHPNQLPNYFRKTFNELIIIPSKLNWKTRFFEENIFSLLHVKNKHTVLLEYDNYFFYVISFLLKVFDYHSISKIVLKTIYGIDPKKESYTTFSKVQQTGENVGTKRKREYNLRERKPKGKKKTN